MLKWLATFLAGDPAPSADDAQSLTPVDGAAGLLVGAAHADGVYTEVERDLAASALMKLFRMPRREALDLCERRHPADGQVVRVALYAEASRALEPSAREALLAWLWRLVDHGGAADEEVAFVMRVATIWGMDPARARGLRAATQADKEA